MLAETPVTQRSPCYSAVSSSLMNPLPDCSNYSPFCHTHYLILSPDTSLVYSGQTLYQAAPLETKYFTAGSTLLQNLVGNAGEMQLLEEAEQQAEASVDVLPPPLQIVISVPRLSLFSLSLSSLCSLSQSSLFSLSLFPLASPPSLLSLPINSLSP